MYLVQVKNIVERLEMVAHNNKILVLHQEKTKGRCFCKCLDLLFKKYTAALLR